MSIKLFKKKKESFIDNSKISVNTYKLNDIQNLHILNNKTLGLRSNGLFIKNLKEDIGKSI